MKYLQIIFLILSCLVLITSCSDNNGKEIKAAVSNSEAVISDNNAIRREYNGYIVLETDYSDYKTSEYFEQIKFIADNIDSTDKKIMKLLMELLLDKAEAADEENARVFNAEISGVYESDGKIYMMRSCGIMGSAVIFDLWLTDGQSVYYTGDFISSDYVWMYPIENGESVIVTTEYSVRGFDYRNSPLIAAKVYTIGSGLLTEYVPDEGKQFFWLYTENKDEIDGDELYILDSIEDGFIFAPEDVTKRAAEGKFKQELVWSGGKIEAELTEAKSYTVVPDNSPNAGKSGYITQSAYEIIVYTVAHECGTVGIEETGSTTMSDSEMFAAASAMLNAIENPKCYAKPQYGNTASERINGFYEHNSSLNLDYKDRLSTPNAGTTGETGEDAMRRAAEIVNYVLTGNRAFGSEVGCWVGNVSETVTYFSTSVSESTQKG